MWWKNDEYKKGVKNPVAHERKVWGRINLPIREIGLNINAIRGLPGGMLVANIFIVVAW